MEGSLEVSSGRSSGGSPLHAAPGVSWWLPLLASSEGCPLECVPWMVSPGGGP